MEALTSRSQAVGRRAHPYSYASWGDELPCNTWSKNAGLRFPCKAPFPPRDCSQDLLLYSFSATLGRFGQVLAAPGRSEKPSELRTCCSRPLLPTPSPWVGFPGGFLAFSPQNKHQWPDAELGSQLALCQKPGELSSRSSWGFL